ncbi:MAG: hypothetical protein IAC78_01495 [Firmicutes bacterium]|uniref:Uncharacterized protein n=1 Tax=Candidatus Scatoplasma merdavium TaxID=2840932 RepID=A0A9D9GLC6_9BACL|nr:hypothetical protein [Candidatus Scatoplasma merdavium]
MKNKEALVSNTGGIKNLRFVKKIIEMDKKVFLQKTGWIYLVLAGAFIFVYGLIMATPMADLRYLQGTQLEGMEMEGDAYIRMLTGSINTMCILGWALILDGLLYKFVRNDKRRIYYISNMVFSAVSFLLFIGIAIGALSIIVHYKGVYDSIPFDIINSYPLWQMSGYYISETSWVFPLGYCVFIFTILASFVYIFVICYKWKDFAYYMKNHEVPDSDTVEERM